MFIIIVFTAICLLVTVLADKQKSPKIDPKLLKRFFWSEMRVYQNRKKTAIVIKQEAQEAQEAEEAKREAKKLIEKARIDEEGILPIYLGIGSEDNKEYRTDLTELPHLLIAGATGQGKSNFLNHVITGFTKLPKSMLQMHLVDIKEVELSDYEALKNVTLYMDCEACMEMLEAQKVVMKKRLTTLRINKCKNVIEFNERFKNPMPFIIIVIDEFASVPSDNKEQKLFNRMVAYFSNVGRAAGYHLILATQYPSAESITTKIRNNMGGKVCFKTGDAVGSRVVLDKNGAEELRERGRCLFQHRGQLTEIQTPKFEG